MGEADPSIKALLSVPRPCPSVPVRVPPPPSRRPQQQLRPRAVLAEAALDHHAAALGGGQGWAEEMALEAVAAEAFEPLPLRLLLDAFGDDADLQAQGEGDDRRGDLLAAAADAQGMHEGAVHLEGVDGEGGEVG